jgi:hypothetical protein
MAHSTPKKGCNGTLTPFTPDAGADRRGQEGQTWVVIPGPLQQWNVSDKDVTNGTPVTCVMREPTAPRAGTR